MIVKLKNISKRIVRIFTILSLFAIIVFNSACNSKGTTKDIINAHITREGLKNIKIAIELYRYEFGIYPETLDELLMRKGITERSIIEDAWGRPYHYIKINESYEVFSVGRDKRPFTSDDVHPPD